MLNLQENQVSGSCTFNSARIDILKLLKNLHLKNRAKDGLRELFCQIILVLKTFIDSTVIVKFSRRHI